MDNVANAEELSSCCCGSTNLKELKPYGIESIQCRDCHVSLRKQDWNRVMQPHHSGYQLIGIDPAEGHSLVPVEPTIHMQYAAESVIAEFCTSSRQSRHHDIASQAYKAMIAASLEGK